MRTTIVSLLLFALLPFANAQTAADKYNQANTLADDGQIEKAYLIVDSLLKVVDQKDTLYSYVLFSAGAMTAKMAMEFTTSQKWKEGINYGNAFLSLYNDNKEFFDTQLEGRLYWVYKNLLVSSRALKLTAAFDKYRKLLYDAYKKGGVLPDPLDQYFNFEFFTWNGLNVWGYEWYPEIGDPETKGSYSKHVYYIYSTKANGDDDKQLFTLQTVKVHKIDDKQDDYVLTFRRYSENGDYSKTHWKATFKDPVDYDKLHDAVVDYLDTMIKPHLSEFLEK
jgi:hypothetical protein